MHAVLRLVMQVVLTIIKVESMKFETVNETAAGFRHKARQ